MKKILFVCSGNVFRSLSAEYCLEKILKQKKNTSWQVMSAGITAKPQPIDPKTRAVLKKCGIITIKHQQHKLNRRLLASATIVIPMAKNHLNFIQSKFGYTKAKLFNQVALGKRTSIWDIEDEVKDYATNRIGVEKKIEKTIRYIAKQTPRVYKNLQKYILTK